MEVADNMYKWIEIPYYQSQPYLQNIEKTFNDFSSQGVKSNLFGILLPAVYRVSFVQARLDRNVDMLRTIEAIRMFTANNSNQFPEKLSDIRSVLVPCDPVTGKDFIYKRIDLQNARLEAPKAPQEDRDRPVYILTIKK